jgi:hemoglobin-like flavoprotein
MVDTAVHLLEAGENEKLVSALKKLGARHHKYNIDQFHHLIVGQALIDTLAAAHGADFTEEVRDEWSHVATLIFTTMMTSW